VGASDKTQKQRAAQAPFGQVSGYRLDQGQALIATKTGKLLPQLSVARNVLANTRHYNLGFFHSLWINTMNRCFYPHGEARP
jgi:hypothetical protein